MNIENKEEVKSNVLNAFDFDRVYKVMTVVDWKWGMGGTVPSAVEIKERASRLIDELLAEPHFTSISSGGLKASIEFDCDITLLRLEFILTSECELVKLER